MKLHFNLFSKGLFAAVRKKLAVTIISPVYR
jgi:hypothetical protein